MESGVLFGMRNQSHQEKYLMMICEVTKWGNSRSTKSTFALQRQKGQPDMDCELSEEHQPAYENAFTLARDESRRHSEYQCTRFEEMRKKVLDILRGVCDNPQVTTRQSPDQQ